MLLPPPRPSTQSGLFRTASAAARSATATLRLALGEDSGLDSRGRKWRDYLLNDSCRDQPLVGDDEYATELAAGGQLAKLGDCPAAKDKMARGVEVPGGAHQASGRREPADWVASFEMASYREAYASRSP